ncbi:MAG: tyrosine--tRNA ligase [Candidatus Berkelbacteria bacterium]|nr:tyrosine--tRNA ligase [Candidatus Berkelbacteria bacterium]MCR4307844.1 tyrosine--tRNA ligase [Candidatus Berkelbacteria bacterium]
MDTSKESTLTWAVAEIIEPASLSRRLKGTKKLVVKLGIDPTSRELHLGHAVVLRKLRQFQDLGHQAVLVIGDFTGLIGDPSGVNITRPALSKEQIRDNMVTYMEQAGRIIDLKKVEIVYNSKWLSKISLPEFIDIASKVSLNGLVEREDFAKRLGAGKPVALHELIYAVAMAIDSVELKADIELGGWDQRLNLLLGRELQKKSGQIPQDLVIMRPLIGLDGVRKMSSSLGNYIGLTDSGDQMFGKVMSIPDSLIVHYGELAALMGTESEVKASLKNIHPREQKVLVASRIVELYHGAPAAKKALKNFNQTFRDKKVADHMASELLFSQKSISLLHAVAQATECSNTQAGRLISQGAIKLNGVKMTDPKLEITLTGELILHIGKHAFRKLGRRK